MLFHSYQSSLHLVLFVVLQFCVHSVSVCSQFLTGMSTRPGKSNAEVEAEARCCEHEARDVAQVVNACAPT